ncbi:MAG: TonB-dependent receptor plug domain-containing protein [Bdellovibrionales bacterium]
MKWLTLALCSIFATITAFAQEGGDNLDEMSLEDLLGVEIQVASGGGETVFNSPSTVTVIDRDTIERYNFLSVGEAIETLAGLTVQRTYFKRQMVNARGYLHDHYANRVLIMVNGIGLFHPSTGEGNIDRIGIDLVDRIEVLKGPASVIYGSNAYTAAINVITRHEKKGGHGKGLIAERGTIAASAHMSGVEDDDKTFVGAHVEKSNGPDQKTVDESGNTGFFYDKMDQANLTGRYQKGAHTLTVNGLSGDEGYIGGTTNKQRENDFGHRSESYMAHYAYSRKLTDKWDMRFTLLYDHELRQFSRTPTIVGTWPQTNLSDVVGHREQATVRSGYRLTEDLNLKAGVDWDKRFNAHYNVWNQETKDTSTENDMNNKSVTETSAFAELDYKFSDFRIIAGSRYTDNENFGGNVSSRGAVVWSFDKQNALKFVYGQAYRSPSLFELYFAHNTASASTQGNPDLDPETSDTFELAYLAKVNNFFFQLLGYHATYKNKIARLSTGVGAATRYANVDDFSADGIEFESRADFSFMNVFWNINYIDGTKGDDVSDHYNFKYVPNLSSAVGVNVPFGKFALSGVVNYYDDTNGPLAGIPKQATFDLNLRHKSTLGGNAFSQYIFYKHAGNSLIYPEYVRRSVNDVPSGWAPTLGYAARMTF